MKVCLEPGCWTATDGTRCSAHEREFQRARNLRRGAVRKPSAAYRKVSMAGLVCACCGTPEDLTRHHVSPMAARRLVLDPGELLPMCRRCNSSIGTRVMEGSTCPMHGGTVRGG